ncbi:MAG: molybdopterin-guanine dinucleotide biosynthesis protein MobB [Motiliproteus sp.]|nr:molybdopterin-guanine dinucleotide biosynthesis protein MobB [Motiliproteus sp.]MCW9053843.1 molybdopterin-guanine dinucleotide biosynthesis protein MobB [Motiliproteus sp.]
MSQQQPIQAPLPMIGFAAYSGTGKTTLLKQLIPLLNQRGIRVGMIKHAHHRFDVDTPGKDSYELRKAGAEQMLIASGTRWALMTETPDQDKDPSLEYLISRLDLDTIDLIMVEGFKQVPFSKIELHRPSTGNPLLFPQDDNILAFASDTGDSIDCPLPRLDINEPNQICQFIIDHFNLQPEIQQAL